MNKTFVALLLLGAASSTAFAQTEKVSIRFAAEVGGQPFKCGESYGGIGSTNSRITPSDFRFYVTNVELIDANGKAVPVALDQDAVWQYRNVSLLDFENRTGPCVTGTAETHDVVTGSVPKGAYRGLRFQLGVPFELNHADATIAPSPLNLTSLFWNWQAGYKFLRIDLASSGRQQDIKPGDIPRFGDREGSNRLGFAIHIGSTMCAASGPTDKPTACANSNRATIEFANFDVAKNVVVADLKSLLNGVNVDVNQPETPAGCMSTPTDGDCNPLMRNAGLAFGGAQSDGQKFFRVK
jgi:uncharacterized repeat protein (TIGR04052 family)